MILGWASPRTQKRHGTSPGPDYIQTHNAINVFV